MKKIIDKLNFGDKDLSIIKNIFGTFIIKGGALGVSLLTMPIYINFFENEAVLGIWLTLLSLMAWILSFDLGIGNGLRNILVTKLEEKDEKQIKQNISSSYIVFSLIVIALCIIGNIVIPFINWNSFFNIRNNVISQDIFVVVMRITLIGVMLQFLLKLITSILYALQKAALPNFIALITSVVQLLFALFLPSSTASNNLIIFSVVYVLAVNVPLVIVTIYVFKKPLYGYFPKYKYFNKDTALSLLKLGGTFFWVQIMFMVLIMTNEIMISKIFGSNYVVEYSIYNKIFTIFASLFTIALTPLWSAITKAISQQDYDWVLKIYKFLNKIFIVAVLLEIAIVPILQIIFNLWLGDNSIKVNYINAIIFSCYGCLFIYQTILSTIACGLARLRTQFICYTIGVLIKFIFVYFVAQIWSDWIIIILSNIFTLLPYCLIEPINIKKMIKGMDDTKSLL